MATLSVIASAYATHGNSLNGTSPLMVQASLQLMQFHSIGLILVGILGQSRPKEQRLMAAGVLCLVGCLLVSLNSNHNLHKGHRGAITRCKHTGHIGVALGINHNFTKLGKLDGVL